MKAMEKLVHAYIEVDMKMVSKSLPPKMILYAVDADHFVITLAQSKKLARTSLTSEAVKVAEAETQYLIHIPTKVYDFYRLEENDYTVMVSEKEPFNIVVSI